MSVYTPVKRFSFFHLDFAIVLIILDFFLNLDFLKGVLYAFFYLRFLELTATLSEHFFCFFHQKNKITQ